MVSGRALGRAFFMSAAFVASAAFAQPRPALPALAMIEPGLWQLRTQGETPRSICVADPNSLIQLRHRAAPCSRLVIASEKAAATVHYSCPGAGWGRTTLRVETPRLARIDSQGIADNEPFAFTAEARRIGPCGEQLSAGR
jgi:hypothetical protein